MTYQEIFMMIYSSYKSTGLLVFPQEVQVEIIRSATKIYLEQNAKESEAE